MSRLALGTVQFGLNYGIANNSGQVTYSEANSMLRLASSSGIDLLDTAISYGDSESFLGKAGTNCFKVVTKLPEAPIDCGEIKSWINEQIEMSLQRLKLTSVYGLLLHQPHQMHGKNGNELFHILNELKDDGVVKKIGISIYSPDELNLLLTKYSIDIVQAPFNLVDQRLYNSGWLYRLKNENIEVHTRSSFLQGLLLMNESDIPNKFLYWKELWSTWNEWLAANKVSAVQACLSFLLSFPEIDRVLVGADNISQLKELIESEKELQNLDFPDICCSDKNLINPSNWDLL